MTKHQREQQQRRGGSRRRWQRRSRIRPRIKLARCRKFKLHGNIRNSSADGQGRRRPRSGTLDPPPQVCRDHSKHFFSFNEDDDHMDTDIDYAIAGAPVWRPGQTIPAPGADCRGRVAAHRWSPKEFLPDDKSLLDTPPSPAM